jgi:chromosome partitioning protein
MGTIISVVNQKGGVGKTTSAINIASYLADKFNKKVLLVDLDPQGNATSGLGINKSTINKSILSGLLNEETFNILRHSTKVKNLDIIPANSELASAEINLTKLENREHRLKQFLSEAQPNYDYIIIDCPPSLGLLFVNALVTSRYMLIAVQTEFYAMEGLGLLIGTIQKIQQSLNPALSILGVLMTMYDSRTVLSTQVKDEIDKVFENLVFKTVIPRNVKLAEAPSHGLPIYKYDKWSKGAKAYKNVTKEVLSRVEA